MERKFSMDVVKPHKKRNFCKCTKGHLCDESDKLVNQNEKFSAILNEIKREAPNEFFLYAS